MVVCREMEILHSFLFSVADLKKINTFLTVWCSESDKKSFYFTVMISQMFVYCLLSRL